METHAIQRAYGHNSGEITISIGLAISGLRIALAKGWELTLCILGATPLLLLQLFILNKAINYDNAQNFFAFWKSAAYAQ